MLIPEHRVIFYVPETDGLVMQRAAMETRVACCAGRVRNPPPFALTPSIHGGTLSPGGISHTTSALFFNPLNPPTPEEFLDWLFSIKAVRAHTC